METASRKERGRRIMEVFDNKNFTAKEMKEINRYSMYLKAFYLSDIADISG
jgi:hypothetical protein